MLSVYETLAHAMPNLNEVRFDSLLDASADLMYAKDFLGCNSEALMLLDGVGREILRRAVQRRAEEDERRAEALAARERLIAQTLSRFDQTDKAGENESDAEETKQREERS